VGQGCDGEHVCVVHCMVLGSKQVPLAGGEPQRGEQNSFGCEQACAELHASVVHCRAMVSKQAPLTGPWHSARHPWSVARHAAPLPRKPTAHCSKQSGASVPAGQPCTHASPALNALAKHVCALLLHGAEHVSTAAAAAAAGQLVPQSARVARHATFAARAVLTHPSLHCAAAVPDPQPNKQAFLAVCACMVQTRLPLAHPRVHWLACAATCNPIALAMLNPVNRTRREML